MATSLAWNISLVAYRTKEYLMTRKEDSRITEHA
jgi:hypothetical protein